jgi:hypothetical protein
MQLVEMGRIMDVEEYYTRSVVKKQREPFDEIMREWRWLIVSASPSHGGN